MNNKVMRVKYLFVKFNAWVSGLFYYCPFTKTEEKRNHHGSLKRAWCGGNDCPAKINLFPRVHSSESIFVGSSSPRTMRLAPKTITINAAIKKSRMRYIGAPVSLNSDFSCQDFPGDIPETCWAYSSTHQSPDGWLIYGTFIHISREGFSLTTSNGSSSGTSLSCVGAPTGRLRVIDNSTKREIIDRKRSL